jgi:cytoskeletal protein RodZ
MAEERSLSPFAVALRQSRLSRALSVNDGVKATLLSDKQILGLENDDYSYFYNSTFAYRSAATYAKFLDVDLALEGAPSQDNRQLPRLVVSIETTSKSNKSRRLSGSRYQSVFLLGLLVVLLLGYVFRSSYSTSNTDQEMASRVIENLPQPPPSPNAATPTLPIAVDDDLSSTAMLPDAETVQIGEAPPTIESIPRSTAQLEISQPLEWDQTAKENRFFIVINKATAISASDSLGTSLLSGLQQPTTGRRVVGKRPFEILVSDAEAVEIYYLGARIRPNRQNIPDISVAIAP